MREVWIECPLDYGSVLLTLLGRSINGWPGQHTKVTNGGWLRVDQGTILTYDRTINKTMITASLGNVVFLTAEQVLDFMGE